MLIPFLCYIITLCLTLYGVQYHIKISQYPWFFSIPVTLAVFLPLSIVVLLPLDYISHSGETPKWYTLPDELILYLWKTTYWVTFALTWLFLPVLQEYYRSGKFNELSKLSDALKSNLKYQAIVLGVSIFGLIYLLLEVGLSFSHLKLMVIAISHVYSLVLVLWLMGHGLISIPKNRWIAGSHIRNLNHYYMKLPKLVDSLEDTKVELREQALQVLVLENNFTDISVPENLRLRDWILHLSCQIPWEIKKSLESVDRVQINRNQLSESFMTKLTSDFQISLGKYVAYESEVKVLYHKIFQLEDILNASPVKYRTYTSFLYQHLPPNLYSKYILYVAPIWSKIMAISLFICSLIIIESEFLHSTSLSLMNFLELEIANVTLKLIFNTISFSYMLFAGLNSLTRLKIFNMYHLVPHKSDPVSACFYATYIARLTLPLSYNYITLFIDRSSIFESWYGASIVLDPLFTIINNWVPRFLLLPVIFASLNVYDRLKTKLGFGSDVYNAFFDEQDSDPSRRNDVIILEGKRIANREWLKIQSQLNRGHRSYNEGEDLRRFNLSQAADLNYENNRTSFNDNLMNRIDLDHSHSLEHSQPPTNSLPSNASQQSSPFWTSINGAFSGIKRNILGTRAPSYRDEPELEQFDYDDDNDNLVI